MARPSNIRVLQTTDRLLHINRDDIAVYRMDASLSQMFLWMKGSDTQWSLNCTVEQFEDAMWGDK